MLLEMCGGHGNSMMEYRCLTILKQLFANLSPVVPIIQDMDIGDVCGTGNLGVRSLVVNILLLYVFNS